MLLSKTTTTTTKPVKPKNNLKKISLTQLS